MSKKCMWISTGKSTMKRVEVGKLLQQWKELIKDIKECSNRIGPKYLSFTEDIYLFIHDWGKHLFYDKEDVILSQREFFRKYFENPKGTEDFLLFFDKDETEVEDWEVVKDCKNGKVLSNMFDILETHKEEIYEKLARLEKDTDVEIALELLEKYGYVVDLENMMVYLTE